jgi:hypothetical protein
MYKSILSILPFAKSITILPKRSSSSSDVLPVLSLRHNQPSSALANPTNNIPSASATYHISNAKQCQPGKQVRHLPTVATPTPPQIRKPPQQTKRFFTHGTILTITRGSNTDFDTKRQQRDYYRQVNHVAVEGHIIQTKWSHIPIT